MNKHLGEALWASRGNGSATEGQIVLSKIEACRLLDSAELPQWISQALRQSVATQEWTDRRDVAGFNSAIPPKHDDGA